MPQGSILGPLSFLVYLNHYNYVTCDINLLAEDTSLIEVVNNPNLSASRLNQELVTLHKWASQWLVTFDPSKTEVITFFEKWKRDTQPAPPPPTVPQCYSFTQCGLPYSSWSYILQ